jgi:hypothetical protein
MVGEEMVGEKGVCALRVAMLPPQFLEIGCLATLRLSAAPDNARGIKRESIEDQLPRS